MSEVIITSIVLKLFLGGVGIFGMLIALRMFDRWAGINFRKAFDSIETDAKALALYFGLRLIALALVTAGALL